MARGWLVVALLVAGCAKDSRDWACRQGKGEACFTLGAELQAACGRDCPNVEKARRIADLFQRGCDLDEPRACHDLGYLYSAGVGVTRDPGQAATLYRRACDQGVARGCSNYAWQLRDGTQVEPNLHLAVVYGEKACDGSDGPGCCGLGKLLEFEKGFVDLPRARKVFARGCTLRDGCSCDGFAYMVERGLGGPADRVRALGEYQKACSYGEMMGCGNAGVLLSRAGADGGAADLPRALPLLEKACASGEQGYCVSLANGLRASDAGPRADELLRAACASGHTSGCLHLGLVAEQTDGVRAISHFLEACNQGDLRGCAWAGNVYLDGKTAPKDEARALELFERACAGDPPNEDGCFNLAWMLHGGLATKADSVRAYQLVAAGCERGFARSCVTAGVDCEGGDGTTKDLARARADYDRACSLGDGTGCSNLGVLYRDAVGVKRDHRVATEQFRRACELKEPWGCSNLGIQIFRGDGVERDEVKAMPLLMQGCDADDGEACFLLARKSDRTHAKELVAKACSLGFKPACAK